MNDFVKRLSKPSFIPKDIKECLLAGSLYFIICNICAVAIGVIFKIYFPKFEFPFYVFFLNVFVVYSIMLLKYKIGTRDIRNRT
ncbi:MAG: hypothetical protein P4L22_06905 [Candidatus Babeliales bacterium]|nr:hypothetical protein [Candidatus Babeliales bacterium]